MLELCYLRLRNDAYRSYTPVTVLVIVTVSGVVLPPKYAKLDAMAALATWVRVRVRDRVGKRLGVRRAGYN